MLRSNELTYLCELKLAKADLKRLSITEQTFVKCNVELSLLEMVEIDPLDIHVAEAREPYTTPSTFVLFIYALHAFRNLIRSRVAVNM